MSDAVGDHSRIVNHALVPPSGVYEIDSLHTFVGFSAQHLVVGRVRGYFEALSGTVVVADDPSESTVEVSVETASINTKVTVRDDDLRSERYLDVANHPTMTYRSTSVTATAKGTWLVTGDFTLRGATRSVELTVRFGGSVTDDYGNARLGFHAHGSITRSEYGLTYELVKEAGGLLVGRDIELDIDAEVIRPL